MESSFTSNYQCYKCGNCGNTRNVTVQDIEEQYKYEDELSMRLKEIYGPMGSHVVLEEYSVNMTVQIKCESCQKFITVIVEVNGRPVWSYPDDNLVPSEPLIENFSDIRILRVLSSDSQFGYSLDRFVEEASEEPDYDYFPDIYHIESPKEVHYVNLKIIAKTSMMKGYCHLGFDSQRGRFFRPLYRWQEDRCCWDEPLEIDKVYVFKILKFPCGGAESQTSLPHSNEDLLVEYQAIRMESMSVPRPDTFKELLEIAKSSVEEIFGSGIKQLKYVDENTDCPSVGVLICKGRDLKLVRDSFEYNKRRVKIGEHSFRITAGDAAELPEDLPDLPTLVILGLGRPFPGTRPHHFNPRRCYILALRILQYPFFNYAAL